MLNVLVDCEMIYHDDDVVVVFFVEVIFSVIRTNPEFGLGNVDNVVT